MADKHSEQDLGRMLEHAMNAGVALRGIENPQAWVKQVRDVTGDEAWQPIWKLLNWYASGDCLKNVGGTDPNAVLGELYQQLAILYHAQKQLNTPGPKEGAHEQDARGGQSPP